MTNEEFANYAKCCWIRLNVLKAKRMTQEEKELSAMAYMKYTDELNSLSYGRIGSSGWGQGLFSGDVYREQYADKDSLTIVVNPSLMINYNFFSSSSSSSLIRMVFSCCGVVSKRGGIAIYPDETYVNFVKLGGLLVGEMADISSQCGAVAYRCEGYCLLDSSGQVLAKSETKWRLKRHWRNLKDKRGVVAASIIYRDGEDKPYHSNIIENDTSPLKFDTKGNEVFYCDKRKQWRRK